MQNEENSAHLLTSRCRDRIINRSKLYQFATQYSASQVGREHIKIMHLTYT